MKEKCRKEMVKDEVMNLKQTIYGEYRSSSHAQESKKDKETRQLDWHSWLSMEQSCEASV